MKFFVAIAALIAAAAADNTPAPAYAPAPAPAYKQPAPAYKPARSYAPAPQYADVPPAYNYQYAVADGYSGVNLNQQEERNGYATSGSYTVALPDGRTQTVTYTVTDDQSGAIMDVQYSGEAQYPEAKAYKPAPAAYKPAPVAYKPAPTYAPAPAPTYAPAKPTYN